MSDPRKIALDSCSILHLLVKSEGWYDHLRPIYEDAEMGRVEIIVSEVTVAECSRLDVPKKEVAEEDQRRILDDFFKRSFIRRRAVTARESTMALRLIREHSIGTCDAIIAATAAFAGAEVLYTTDGCTKRRKPGRLLPVGCIQCADGRAMPIRAPNALEYAGFYLPLNVVQN